MLCSTHDANVIFVALLGCKYIREDKTRKRFDRIPKALSVVRHALDNLKPKIRLLSDSFCEE